MEGLAGSRRRLLQSHRKFGSLSGQAQCRTGQPSLRCEKEGARQEHPCNDERSGGVCGLGTRSNCRPTVKASRIRAANMAANVEVATSELQRAVEPQHEARATHRQSVPIRETHNGATVWEGVVR